VLQISTNTAGMARTSASWREAEIDAGTYCTRLRISGKAFCR